MSIVRRHQSLANILEALLLIRIGGHILLIFHTALFGGQAGGCDHIDIEKLVVLLVLVFREVLLGKLFYKISHLVDRLCLRRLFHRLG